MRRTSSLWPSLFHQRHLKPSTNISKNIRASQSYLLTRSFGGNASQIDSHTISPKIESFRRTMTNSSEDTKPIPVSDYFESAYSLEGGFPFENLHYYADGILFPVHIADLFPPPEEGNKSHLYRYKIMLKIGHGSYSTVWLALDLENQQVNNIFILDKI